MRVTKLFASLFALFRPNPSRAAGKHNIPCYHCHELMLEQDVIAVNFAGQERQVCCHGCQAVLQTIESSKMTQDYLRFKQSQTAALQAEA